MTLFENILTAQREMEHMFAGCAWTDPAHAISECGYMRPEMFSDTQVGKFWAQLQSGVGAVEAGLEAGIVPQVLRWMNDVGSFYDIRDYANQIQKHAYLSTMATGLEGLARAIATGDVEQVRQVTADLAEERPAGGLKPATAEELHVEFTAMLSGGNRSIQTGIPGLDTNTGGLERKTLSVLAARPSMGKTALGLQVARNVAAQGKTALVFSLEMSRSSLWARIACPLIGVTWMDVRAKKITEAQEDELFRRGLELAQSYGDHLLVDDRSGISVTDMWRAVQVAKPDFVLVDHLGLVRHPEKNIIQRLGFITYDLKALAKSLDCHVQVISQLSRGTEQRNDKRPSMADIRDSGEVEQNADQVFGLYRASYYTDSAPAKLDPTELWILKFRDGLRNSRVNLMFNMADQWFEPAERVPLNGRVKA